VIDQSATARSATFGACESNIDAGFVDEHEPRDVPTPQATPETTASVDHVGPFLLECD
jgi:hypothetical protein